MANIKEKDINNLSTWNIKELRKLRINLKNRIESLSLGQKSKELQKSHPLLGKDLGDCKQLLEEVSKAERALTK